MSKAEPSDDELIAEASASAFNADGVDVTLIDWMLAMSPLERLRVLERRAFELAPFVTSDAGH